jgi:NDP-sugar pyrophosphorylase family protein
MNPTKARGKQAKQDSIVGFCLAAGEGTRLQPLTRVTAKPLLAPAGRALLDLALTALALAGAGRAVVNLHHGADQIAAWLAAAAHGPEPWPATVDAVREEHLLGTGGGLANAVALGLLDAPAVLITCADHVVDPADLRRLVEPVLTGRAEATMGLVRASALGGSPTFALAPSPAGVPPQVHPEQDAPWLSAGLYAVAGPVLAERFTDALPPPQPAGSVAEAGSLPSATDPSPSGATPASREASSTAPQGLSMPHTPVPNSVPATLEAVSLVEALLEPLWLEGRLAGVPLASAIADGGTLDGLLGIAEGLLAGRWPYRLPPGRRSGDAWVAEGASVHAEARLHGPVVVDRGATVGARACVTRSVLGAGSEIPEGAIVRDSVLGPGARLSTARQVEGALVAGLG